MSKHQTETSYIEVRNLKKSLGRIPVLNDVTFSIPEGKTTVILGGSGQGKSVLLKHLNGLIQPDSGSVLVEGTEIGSLSEAELAAIRRHIGILFQDGALFDSMTVAENVSFPLRERWQVERTDIASLVSEILNRVGLSQHENKLPGELSGGMRKRVGLARAMITQPRCLLCDEPTSGLDPVLAATVSQLIHDTVEEGQLTAVVVTHDLGAIRRMADHVLFLNGGRISFSGSPDEFFQVDDTEIQSFLSSSTHGG